LKRSHLRAEKEKTFQKLLNIIGRSIYPLDNFAAGKRKSQDTTIENRHPMHCAQGPPVAPQRLRRARIESKNEKEKTTHCVKKANSGKKQEKTCINIIIIEGTNERCPNYN